MTLHRAAEPHLCAPPLEDHVRRLPADGRPGDDWYTPEQVWTERTPPPPGSTWRCPGCDRLWTVQQRGGDNGRLYVFPHRVWEPASLLQRLLGAS